MSYSSTFSHNSHGNELGPLGNRIPHCHLGNIPSLRGPFLPPGGVKGGSPSEDPAALACRALLGHFSWGLGWRVSSLSSLPPSLPPPLATTGVSPSSYQALSYLFCVFPVFASLPRLNCEILFNQYGRRLFLN